MHAARPTPRRSRRWPAPFAIWRTHRADVISTTKFSARVSASTNALTRVSYARVPASATSDRCDLSLQRHPFTVSLDPDIGVTVRSGRSVGANERRDGGDHGHVSHELDTHAVE